MNDPRSPGAPGPYSPTPGMSPVPRLPTQPPHAPPLHPSGAPHQAVPNHAGPGHTLPGHVGPGHVGPGHVGPGHVGPGPGQFGQPAMPPRPTTPGDQTIALDDGPAPAPTASKIKAFGVDAERRREDWKRKTHTGGQHSCRVRSFHGKYSDQGLAHMDDIINDWLDHHPEVEVKFVTSTVGVFEGKIREPALVLNIWY